MSEERDKRDSHSDDADVTADSIESTDSAASGSDIAASSEDAVGASGTDTDQVQLSKPSGKRSSRRARAGDEDTESGATKVAVRTDKSSKSVKADKSDKSDKARGEKRPNVFKRLRKFFREVIAELRKVIWPNRKQMVTYTAVVLVFVTFMVAFISGLDLAFIKGVGWLFG